MEIRKGKRSHEYKLQLVNEWVEHEFVDEKVRVPVIETDFDGEDCELWMVNAPNQFVPSVIDQEVTIDFSQACKIAGSHKRKFSIRPIKNEEYLKSLTVLKYDCKKNSWKAAQSKLTGILNVTVDSSFQGLKKVLLPYEKPIVLPQGIYQHNLFSPRVHPRCNPKRKQKKSSKKKARKSA